MCSLAAHAVCAILTACVPTDKQQFVFTIISEYRGDDGISDFQAAAGGKEFKLFPILRLRGCGGVEFVAASRRRSIA